MTPYSGALFCAVFLVTDAVRSVYFAGMFQRASSFVVGSLVFSVISVFALACVYCADRKQLALAWTARPIVIKVNLLTATSWCMYFFALQLIEPAVAFTLFAGSILLSTLLAAWSGVSPQKVRTNRIMVVGYIGVTLSLLLLVTITLLGLAGFVRGSAGVAALGLCLAVGAGVLIAGALIECKELDDLGLTPLTQLGLRFLLYVVLAGALGAIGLDSKGDVAAPALVEIVVVGIVLTGMSAFAVQKAVSMLTTQALGAATAFGPCLVFAVQLAEGRVDFTPWTLLGVCVYAISALLVSLGQAIPVIHGRPPVVNAGLGARCPPPSKLPVATPLPRA